MIHATTALKCSSTPNRVLKLDPAMARLYLGVNGPLTTACKHLDSNRMEIDLPGTSLDGRLKGLLHAAADKSRRQGRPILTSLTEPIAPTDAISIFDNAARFCKNRLLWLQPDSSFSLIGLDAAYSVEKSGPSRFSETAATWDELCSEALIEPMAGAPLGGPLLMGGFSFDPGPTAGRLWDGYPEARMVLPRACVVSSGGCSWLTLNAVLCPGDTPEQHGIEIERMRRAVMARQTASGDHFLCGDTGWDAPVLSELGSPARWRAEVASAAAAVRRGALRKVVLARAVRLQGERPFGSATALRRLAAGYPTCVVFAVARGDTCFLGATPERLLKVRDGQVSTVCLAGSYARGATDEADRQLGEALLADAKERSEHALVLSAMTDVMKASCTQLDVPGLPEVLKLRNVQHLCTPLSGRLAPGESILRIVERLHPTPSVGGTPREVALKFIREHEGLDRGWYAGPVGWVDYKGEGDFAVAIRAALLRGSQATLFAGCGIVADSDPEREFEESCIKLTPMLTALGAA